MGLGRKLLIAAAPDGLIIHNVTAECRDATDEVSNTLIQYGACHTSEAISAGSVARPGGPSMQAHGLVGVISLASFSFLVAITGRKQVAQIHGQPVFVVTDVHVISLSSEDEASKTVAAATELQKERKQHDSDASSLSGASVASQDSHPDGIPDPDEVVQPVNVTPLGHTSVAEDVFKRQGRYGRFAVRWLSRNGWTSRSTPLQGMSTTQSADLRWAKRKQPRTKTSNKQEEKESLEMDGLTPEGQVLEPNLHANEDESNRIEARALEVLPKFLKFTKNFLSSGNFYFSYDRDITNKYTVDSPDVGTIPLYRRADLEFFWNRHLMKPFIESGRHNLVLPLIQGFVGQHEFSVTRQNTAQTSNSGTPATLVSDSAPSTDTATEVSSFAGKPGERADFLVTLISRRSVCRPGVRYLRRGVDDDGNVANTVETEQILSTPSWESKDKVYSLLQVRGSIPLYFSQSPYSLKPVPILKRSDRVNRASFERHMNALSARYGKIQAVSLIDGHGVETEIGQKYQDFAKKFNDAGNKLAGEPLALKWFDFHHECRGLKFENVGGLVKALELTLDNFGYTVVQNGATLQRQCGIVRTNCMDCLDRTGVAQCAFGQYALGKQLQEKGYVIDLFHDERTQWFNILWADNGDAISKQYSSTAALKGDYTRTRKRNVRGALNDLGLTLSRYFNNLVNDYFSQACIDYFLGNVTIHAFDEFESNLMTSDPGISLEAVRQNAIETCRSIVLCDDSEELLGGWALLSPSKPNTLRTLPLEESVLLLTDAALYCCRLDWDADEIIGYERVDLRSIVKIVYGTYITSTLTECQMDPRHNVGFVLSYNASRENFIRINTRSPKTLVACDKPDEGAMSEALKPDNNSSEAKQCKERDWDMSSFFRDEKRETPRLAAFKILPCSRTDRQKDPYAPAFEERDAARHICEEIGHAVTSCQRRAADEPAEGDSLIRAMEIISVSEAKKQTGILEHLAYDLKRLVWA